MYDEYINMSKGKLYSVEQILNQGLHTSDESISGFAIALLDDIEQFKKNNEQDILEILNDKESSILYVINFGDKIFNNSLKQIQDHKSNKGTALGFLASVNFYDLLKLWPDETEVYDSGDILKKTRYAKFHAARILKSLRKGEDPNEYDPPELDVKEDDQDTGQEELSGEQQPAGLPNEEVSEPIVKNEEEPSLGLPQVPDFIDEAPEQDKSIAKSVERSVSPEFKLPEPPKSLPKPKTPEVEIVEKSDPEPVRPAAKSREYSKNDISQIIESGEIYNKAQKHAKFAISAMNYEDKETALKQLNEAITLLSQL